MTKFKTGKTKNGDHVKPSSGLPVSRPEFLAQVTITLIKGVNRRILLERYGERYISPKITVREYVEGMEMHNLLELDDDGILRMKKEAIPKTKAYRQLIGS